MRCGDITRKHPRSIFPAHTHYLAPLRRGFFFFEPRAVLRSAHGPPHRPPVRGFWWQCTK